MQFVTQATRRDRIIHLANLLAAYERAAGPLRDVLAGEVERLETAFMNPLAERSVAGMVLS